MKKQGFTLIEVIGVVVIIGLVLMIVFPTLSKLMLNNNTKKFDNYYMMIEEASKVYAGTLKDKMGPATQNGCAEFTLTDLVSRDYIKEYKDKRTTCSITSTKIRVKNTRGKIETFFKLKCSDQVPSTSDYIKGVDDVANCIAYTKNEANTLYNAVKVNSAQTTRDVNVVYITNDPVKALNKYLYYSGGLWQIVSYDELQETVKVLSLDYTAALPFNAKQNNNYVGSTISKWLENVYLPTLKNHEEYLTISNYDTTPSANFDLPTATNPAKVVKSKIGLLSAYEARKIKHPTGSGILNRWTLSEGAAGTNVAFTQDNMNLFDKLSHSYGMVIPVITFAADVELLKGTGTQADPYIIEPDYKGEKGQTIDSRPAGEYVYLNYGGANAAFRIMGKDVDGNVRVNRYTGTAMKFDETTFDFSSSDIQQYLNTTEYNKFSAAAKTLLVDGYFCNDVINDTIMKTNDSFFTTTCTDPGKVKMYKVGLFRVGELYSQQGLTQKIWTLNPNNASPDQFGSTINVINGDYTVTPELVNNVSISYNIVVTINKAALIDSGEGTKTSPYVIK